MDKYGWKLLKAIFFICSSICPILLDGLSGATETSWWCFAGIVSMVIGLVMGWSALIGHYLDDSQKKKS